MLTPPAGVLAHQDIRDLCFDHNDDPRSDAIITACHRESIRTAGYDLRLGHDFYLHPKKKPQKVVEITHLDDNHRTIVVPPNQLVYVSMLERLSLPSDIVGHLSLKVDLLLKGIFLSSQSQIDAGYAGQIFALLYNLSAEKVSLSLEDPILRLELVRLPHKTDKPYRKGYEGLDLAKALKAPVQSSLSELRRKIDAVNSKVTTTRWAGMIAGVLIAGVPTILSYCAPLMRDTVELRSDLDAHVDLNADSTVIDLQSRVEELERAAAVRKEAPPAGTNEVGSTSGQP